MKILSIFIILLLFYSFNYNFKEYFDFNIVYFCNKLEACHILKKYHKWYLDKMNKKEKKVRGIIGDSEEYYCSKFFNFNQKQKNILKRCVVKCNDMANKKGINLENKWKFILSEDLEDNMPHTIGNCIIVNNYFLKLDENRICKTLLHEIFHVLQKTNYNVFKEIYKEWGWKPVQIILNEYHSKNGRMNPDSWDLWEWKNVVPFVILEGRQGLDDIRVIGITYNEDKEDFDLKNWKEYNEKFNVVQNYHPNEISAILLRDFIVDNRQEWAIYKMKPYLQYL